MKVIKLMPERWREYEKMEVVKETHITHTTVGWEYKEVTPISVIGHFETTYNQEGWRDTFHIDRIIYTDGTRWTWDDALKFDEYSSGDLYVEICLAKKFERYKPSMV